MREERPVARLRMTRTTSTLTRRAVSRFDEESRINKGWRERGVRQREDQLLSVSVETEVVLMLRKSRYLATRPKGATEVLDLTFEISRRYINPLLPL
jgi:hypothetical protein